MTMEVSYGGGYDLNSLDLLGRRAVVFKVHQVLSFSQTPVYSQDMTDREVVHVRLQVGAQLGVGFGLTDQDQADNNGVIGEPRVSDATSLYSRLTRIMDILSTPRLPLTISINGNIYLQVPQGVAGSLGGPIGATLTYRTDCRNGPLPVRPTLSKFTGLKGAYLVWEVETWVQKPLGYSNAPESDQPIVLSHRWSEEQVVDSEHYTTRTISGRVVFARNVMTRSGWQPDDFRAYLLRGVPNNTMRQIVRSKCDSSGTSCDYTTVDKVPPENLNSASEILNFTCRIEKGFHNPPGLLNIIPLFEANLTLTIQGRPTTARKTLYQAAMNAAASFGFTQQALDRFGQVARAIGVNVRFPGSTPCFSYKISINMFKREVTLTCGFQAGKDILSDAANFIFANAGELIKLSFSEYLPPITSANYVDSPGPLYDDAFGDLYFGQILVQVPNDTSGPGGIGAVPGFSPVAGQIPNTTLVSISPLNPAIEKAP